LRGPEAIFSRVRRKLNDGNDISATFRVGVPKFLDLGRILTFAIGMPNASAGNAIRHRVREEVLVESNRTDRTHDFMAPVLTQSLNVDEH